MKSLKKMKLINWHYFWNETIEFQPLVFLTGLNGSGKSTLIDAMQILLLGDTTGRFFNKAATEKSARTLKGYLRCEVGDNDEGGFKYLRNNRFTSYIAMEFYDDYNDSYFTFGIVFDCYSDGEEEHRFFCLDDKMPENEFIVDNVPMEYKLLNQYFQENYPGKFKFLDSNRQYQELLKRKFGGLKEKYFSLFKKAVSFTPITDIETFITEYICDSQQNINIASMQENILQYKKLQTEANVMAARIDRLQEIEASNNKVQEYKNDENLCSYIIDRAEVENDLARINSFKDQVKKAESRLQEIDKELIYIDEQIETLNHKKERLQADKLSDNTYRLTDELWDEKKKYEAELTAIEKDQAEVKENLERYATNFIQSGNEVFETLNRFNLDLLEDDRKEEIVELIDLSTNVVKLSTILKQEKLIALENLTADDLTEWKDAVSSFKKHISALNVSLSRTITNLDQKTSLLRQQELDMKNGGKSYERGLVLIKTTLESELTKRHGHHVEVAIFADLIDIKSGKWVNAIEGFLHNQKFNLFVESEFYLEAHEIVRNLMKDYNYYSTNLVDQAKIIERNFVRDANSLAEEIDTDHPGAYAYVNFLIGKLQKCRDAQEARETGNGITAQCELYRNYTLTTINPKLYSPAYIGRKVGEKQIQAKHAEIESNIEMVNLYRELYHVINRANDVEVINNYEITASLTFIEKSSTISGIKQNLEYIETELNKHDLSQLKTIDQRIQDINSDIKSLEDDRTKMILEKGSLTTSIETLVNEKIPNDETIAKSRQDRLENTFDGFWIDEVASPEFQKLIDNHKSSIEIVNEYQIKLNKVTYLLGNSRNQLIKLRKDYIRDYRLSYDAETEDNSVYSNELKDMRDVKLPQYQSAIEDAYQKATKEFKDDFINKLKTAIETVEAQIDDLNNALSSSTFGNDSYRFLVKPSTEYRKYYDMIKDDLLLEVGEDDSAFVTKYEEVMNDLFRQIVDVGGNGDHQSQVLANVDKFTDYRSYLDFDIIVTNKDGVEQHLSKTIKKKSGGETQTPFYIAVLASFAQLYRVNEPGELGNSFRLIIFDEAFSKMDRGRIKESIRLLGKFGLQVILSAPSDKVADISELVDETLVVLHDRRSSSVRLYAEEKKLKN